MTAAGSDIFQVARNEPFLLSDVGGVPAEYIGTADDKSPWCIQIIVDAVGGGGGKKVQGIRSNMNGVGVVFRIGGHGGMYMIGYPDDTGSMYGQAYAYGIAGVEYDAQF